jgi:hypothetical protein
LINQSFKIVSLRAFNEGKEPIMPALHCSITIKGLLIINKGAAITGNDKYSEKRTLLILRLHIFNYLIVK